MECLRWVLTVLCWLCLECALADNTCAAEDGGYAPAALDVADLEESACTITRLAELDAETFKEQWASGDGGESVGRPFIVSGAQGSWNTALFSKASLKKNYGDVRVKVGESAKIPDASGDGYRLLRLGRFLDGISKKAGAAGGPGEEPQYVFDRSDFMRKHAPALVGALSLPPYLPSAQDKSQALYLALGGSSSGVQFHQHAWGWYAQIFGKKRWLLYPPTHVPPFYYAKRRMPIAQWVREVLPELPQGARPLTCVLEPGDLLHVPESWYHATLNLGESVGVAGQGPASTAAQQRLNEVEELAGRGMQASMQGRGAEADRLIKRALKLAPDHAETLDIQGIHLANGGRLPQAVRSFRKAFRFNPLYEQAFDHVLQSLLDAGKDEAAEAFEDEAGEFDTLEGQLKLQRKRRYPGGAFRDLSEDEEEEES
eukprot:g3305.t1